MKLTISEQECKRIKSLYNIVEQMPAITPEDLARAEKEKQEKLKSTYPNYCKYPEYTAFPKRNDGVSGDDALIKNHCMYRQPMEGNLDGQTSGLWLPNTGDTRISFWDESKRIKMYKFASNYAKSINVKIDFSEIVNQIDKIFEDGLVYAFVIDGKLWKPSLTYAPDYFRFSSAGYFINQDKNSKYKNPEWSDERSDYEKFVDNYGMAIQLCTAAITLLLQPFIAPVTGGGSLILWIEIAAELGVGIPVAIREWQRGDYVDSSFSWVTSVLPFLKRFKGFANIKMETWKSLSRILRQAPPVTASPSQFAEWLSKMDIEDRKLLYELLENNNYQLEKLLKELGGEMNWYISVGLKNDVKLAFKNNPELANKFKFWNTLPGRELASNLLVAGPGLIIQAVWGDKINAQDAGKLDGIWQNIPDQYKPELYNIVMSEPENLNKIIDDPNYQKTVRIGMKNYIKDKSKSVGENISKAFIDALNTQGRDTLGGAYVETNTDGSDGFPAVNKTKAELDSMSNEGWYEISDFDDSWGYSEGLQINGQLWLKKEM